MGCSAPVPKTPAPHPAPVVQAPSPVAPQARPPTVTPARVFDESILRGREFLLESSGTSAVVRDTVLGPVGETAEISQTVDRFFRQAADGTLDSQTLVERWASYLEDWAVKIKAQGLTVDSVRVGTALPEAQGTLTVPVRVLSGKKEFRGWIVLVRKSKDYLISDVQVEMEVPSSSPFDPESQGQEISSPIRR